MPESGVMYKKLRREVRGAYRVIVRRDCMETVKIDVTNADKASRLELFIRWIWGFIVAIILCIIGVFAYIAIMIQWIHILILGKRHPALAKFVTNWYKGMAQLGFYYMLSTDERPPLIPVL